ncbi:FAS1-like dehydratase domain-containing protein [Oceanobacillus salinisoli]|uniref:FAS1-like dehydratase domain-containing protein n=1 Tax=Oceanobacillus salinisoli TaxID=2678611 RepID=UPI0012E325A5|nr:MaoC family dehydratase N-terminal domain-containing protein [Oceanobacillus salinisoli]
MQIDKSGRRNKVLKIGDVFTWERTFTKEDVLEFGRISGDQGEHHIEPDENGLLMVQGLLTASIGTKIGGDLNYIAREMVNEFIRPVFTGDTITCEISLTNVQQLESFKKLEMKTIYRNQKGKEVIIGSSYGIIRD